VAGVEIRRARDRLCTRTDWLTSWHSFSYGQHYDADNVGFGPLVVSNHDVLAPGAGFDQHHHAGVDLVTWVVSGTLRHEDSHGHASLLAARSLQVLRSGAGVLHSERNASTTDPVEYVQMWLRAADSTVAYSQPDPPAVLPNGVLAVVDLAPGQAYDVRGDGRAHCYLVRGRVLMGAGSGLEAGDAVRVRGSVADLVAQTHSELLVWTLRKR
jgi:quercetin 2,3-dioxygenase